MKKDKLLVKASVIALLITAGGTYSVVALYWYINSHSKFWDNISYQTMIQSSVMFFFMAIFAGIIIFLYHQDRQKLVDEMDKKDDALRDKNKEIEALNDRINQGKIYDTGRHVAEKFLIYKFVDRMYVKQVNEFTITYIKCIDADSEKRFLSRINYIKGPNMEIFSGGRRFEYIVLFIESSGYDAEQDLRYCLPKGSDVFRQQTFETKKNKKQAVIRFLDALPYARDKEPETLAEKLDEVFGKQ